jgi:hypothetical protein
VVAKAARLVQLMCRTHFGRKVLLAAGLLDAVTAALRSEDPKLKVNKLSMPKPYNSKF